MSADKPSKGERVPWHLLRGTRVRILASYLILLAGFTLLSDLALREALLKRG